jgi:hypothetical protein
MKQVHVGLGLALMLLCISLSGQAQQSVTTAANGMVPPLVQFSNVAMDEGGNTMSGVVSITFSLYNSQQGGEPLWMETQNNVQLDSTGHYSVQLGITKPNGVPTTLFTSGEARWLGVRIAEQAEQARILLLSVPYALKAGDAATIGGLPPSAFVLAAPQNGTASAYTTESTTGQSVSPETATDVTTTGGTADYLPLFNGTSTIIDSVLFQSGTGSTAKIGINTATPATMLDVKGAGTIRGAFSVLGTLSLPATGTATATKAYNSQPDLMVASVFNLSTAVAQKFQLQAEPANNDTASASGTLNLLYGSGASTPAETGLKIYPNGQIVFAAGQTFPGTGTGNGTVTSVGSGVGLTGGPITSSGTLSIDATKVPLLAAANTFTANQTVNGTVTATSFSGSGAGLTHVKAANSEELGGLIPSNYARLFTANTFNGDQIMYSTSHAAVLQVMNYENSGKGPAIVGTTDSNAAAGIKGIVAATSGTEAGVVGQTSSPQGSGVLGQSSNVGVHGISAGASATGARDGDAGIWGDTGGAAGDGYYGVLGTADKNSGGGFFNSGPYPTVYASNYGTGNGVEGHSSGASEEGTAWGQHAGVWGDTGYSGSPDFPPDWNTGYAGVLGTADNNPGGEFFSNGNFPALSAEQDDLDMSYPGPSAIFLAVAGGPDSGIFCTIDTTASFYCVNGADAIVVNSGTGKVALNSVLSTEHWFEDAGSGQLSNGSARIELDPTFARTVNTGVEYHVFLTPKGDCKGLYVTNETATGFDVHELGGGSSSIAFDYRITAKRLGYENVRLKDLTERINRMIATHKMMQRPVRQSAVQQAKPVKQVLP